MTVTAGPLTVLTILTPTLLNGAVAAQQRDTLTNPPVLENTATAPGTVEVTLVAAPAHLALLPGAPTDVFAYNGTVPGPTLELHEGDQVVIHFRNELPEPTTVHWHGMHIPADADGSPFDPVMPGETHDYAFTVAMGSAGTYWYHPHPLHRSAYQMEMGLYGALIVRAADDPLRGVPERLLILTDNRFRPDGSIDLPDPDSPAGRVDAENGREGDVLFVNGQILPALTMRRGELQRWRVLNASAARVYRLALPGREVHQVGTDGGLFERPVVVDEVLLANTERVELLVRGGGAPGDRVVLQSLPYDRYISQTRPADWKRTRALVQVVTTAAPPLAPVPIPERLRPVPPLDTVDAVTTRVMVLGQGMINRQLMDMGRIDARARLGTTEIWQIENVVGMDHPFHLHGFQFQVLDRNGTPVPFRTWKDTVNVPKHETVRFIVRFDDYAGKWMFHCHIFEHEDLGMMGVLALQ